MTRLLPLLALLIAGRVFAADAVCPQKSWEHARTDDTGWSATTLQQATDLARTLDTQSVLVVQGGRIVWEYGRVHSATNIHSMRKSIASMLIGMQKDRGRINLAATLADMGIDEDNEPLTPVERTATVEQIISARSCIYHKAAYEPDDMIANRPARGSCKPGESWYYNNWDFNIVEEVFKRQLNTSLFDALRDDLAVPLGFEDFTRFVDTRYEYDRASKFPAYIMRISAADLARVGLLMARGGDWCGKQLLSREWVDKSTSLISNTGPTSAGYGYMWWSGGDKSVVHFNVPFGSKTFSARGSGGQFVVINPALDLIIVHKVDTESGRRNVGTGDFRKLLTLIMQARKSAGG